MRFLLKTRNFDALSPIVHTKSPENANDNVDFRKRFQK